MSSLLLLLSAPQVQAETWPPGVVIEDAAELHVTKSGLDAAVALIPALLPERIDIGEAVNTDGGYWCFNYEFKMDNVWIGVNLVDAVIAPGNGVLDIEIDLLVNVNDSSDKFGLDYEVACIGSDCPGYVEPFEVSITTQMAMDIVQGPDGFPVLDATLGDVNVAYADITEYLQLDCWIGDLEEILNWLGLSLYELIFGLVESQLESAIADFGPQLEEAVEDAFSAASIQQEIDVLDTTLNLELYPSDIILKPAGMTVVMDGSVSAPPAACVVDSGGSLRTDGPPPTLQSLPSGTEIGVVLSDDFINQAMYAVWVGGVLCYELAGEDPLPINTSLLGLFAGEVYNDLFPETEDMIIATRPVNPPVASFDGTHHMDIVIDQLGLEFYAQVDDRMAKVVGIDLDVDTGVDMVFDGTTGLLAVQVALSSEEITPTVSANELVVGTEEEILENFGGGLDTILETVVGGLLEDIAFGLPGFEGIGLTSMDVEAAGTQRDWLGIWAGIGTIPYEAAGCDEGGGCSGGCSGVQGRSRTFWMLLLPLAIVALRRRDS